MLFRVTSPSGSKVGEQGRSRGNGRRGRFHERGRFWKLHSPRLGSVSRGGTGGNTLSIFVHGADLVGSFR